jgi:hypothetical protein
VTHPPDLSGGSGFTFGDVVVAVYLAALLGERSAPGIESRLVYRVALEQANVGERVDDLIVDGRARDGSKMRLRAQNKREIRISAAAANTDFRDTIVRAWEMLNKADFREGVDRVALITGTVAASPRRAFQDICAWACVSESAESFAARFQPGAAGEQKRAICEAILKILNGIPGRAPNDGDAFRLLRHFILITLDLNYDGSTDQAHVIEQLRDGLLDRTEAGLLWNTLRSLARDGAGRAAEFTKESLITSLRGEFKLRNVEEVLARDIEKTVTRVAEKLEAGQEIDVGRLREIARNLLDAGSPPTLLPLFPGAPETTRRALAQLANLERTVSETRPAANDKEVGKPIAELLAATQLHLLMIAAPGSGKTHALWHLANAMLASDGLIPIFLPTGGFALWDDALRAIADVSGGTDAHVIVRDRRICLLLDGWSEFAQGAGSDERMRAMRVLSRTRIIANGRLGTTSDSTFHTWELDPLPTEAVRKAIRSAFPRSPSAEPSLIELLRLPLALSLFMLLGGLASNKGELLSRLHEQLSRALPEGFRRVLSAAVASVAVSGQGRSYTRFESELRARANRDGLPEPIKKLRKLGTIQDRSGTVAPIHDLYWSWLAGVGLLNEDWLQRSVRQLATRESYELNQESYRSPRSSGRQVKWILLSPGSLTGISISARRQKT